jgi:murein L,D-transpeptidase YcbB/YkuD
MTWHVVPNLEELRDQMNSRFPNRDKSSDGSIGDTSHAAHASSHNPDLTGSPEYRDGDAQDEVRARDFDADLRDSNGITMLQVVQHLVEMARAGRLPHLEYIIFNRQIWAKNTGYATRAYTGANPHDKHVHVNSGFNQAADNATGVDWALNEIGSPTSPPPVVNHPVLKRGDSGDAVLHVQLFFRNVFPSYRNYVTYKRYQLITTDSQYGLQTESWVKEFQKRTDLTRDGVIGPKTLTAMRKFGYRY